MEGRAPCNSRPNRVIYGLIFIAVLVLVEGIYLTVFGKSISLNARVNRRLDLLEKGAGPREGAGAAPQGDDPAHQEPAASRSTRCSRPRRRRPTSPSRPPQLIGIMAVLWRRGLRRPHGRHRHRAARPRRDRGRDGHRRRLRLGQQQGQEAHVDDRGAAPRGGRADGPLAARRPPLLRRHPDRRQGNPRPARHRDGHDLGRGRLRPRHGRQPQGDGRAASTCRTCASSPSR